MKKTFWGYDVREADEVIDSLRSQNSILSSKLTKLNMELAAKSEMETPAPAAAVPEDMRRELEELRAANAELTARAARLQEEAQKLHGKIGALERERNPRLTASTWGRFTPGPMKTWRKSARSSLRRCRSGFRNTPRSLPRRTGSCAPL